MRYVIGRSSATAPALLYLLHPCSRAHPCARGISESLHVSFQAFRAAGGANLDWEHGIPHREGATTFTFSGESTRRSFPGLDADEQVRHKGELVYPNLFMSLAREHVTYYILHAKGPDKTVIDCHFLFELHEIEKDDFDPFDVVHFWQVVNLQDWAICERVQQGMNARVHERGVYAPMEDWNLDIRRYVIDRIGPHTGE